MQFKHIMNKKKNLSHQCCRERVFERYKMGKHRQPIHNHENHNFSLGGRKSNYKIYGDFHTYGDQNGQWLEEASRLSVLTLMTLVGILTIDQGPNLRPHPHQ